MFYKNSFISLLLINSEQSAVSCSFNLGIFHKLVFIHFAHLQEGIPPYGGVLWVLRTPLINTWPLAAYCFNGLIHTHIYNTVHPSLACFNHKHFYFISLFCQILDNSNAVSFYKYFIVLCKAGRLNPPFDSYL